ncbi:PKD domain containing protein [Hymenobacter roseosalivarius DSM 11622]|uniref:PKD domain containing protein n=1 Tax=Hymenobacter roseosalivarius DSM 11622 TaxID=645990 RepID=A0A1W1W4U0_9BACT|nr:PQQ-dependent sugar dehydrogenase [Hymenobacter roseosalivarius]SMC00662.1 PKD domain containing protein [Hymenobacter roseosalivarius DSM 11622]
MKTRLLLLLLILGLPCWQPVVAQTPPSGFSSVTVAAQWDEAVGIAFNKTGSQMFVWERPGRVWVVENGQRSLLINIREEVGGWGDFGLLGFALHPQFDTNGYFYLFYTVDRHHLMNFGTSNYSSTIDDYQSATINRLTRYTATKTTTGYSVNPNSRKILLGATKETGIPILHNSHGTGSLVFGTDGTLLVSAGDGASYNSDDVGSASETYYTQALADGIIPSQQNVGALRSQQLESYNGKVLRLDPETGNGLPSNPFYQSTNPGSVQSKVWALGLRNPFRITLRPGSGSTAPGDGRPGVLYIGDVGYNTWEELNIATRPGMNFGWPLFEGLEKQDGYWSKNIYNTYAPNPAYGTSGCTQQYFYFQDLIKQQTASGTATYLNPCTGQALPATVKTFMHSRPTIDWAHWADPVSRTGTFSGETATTINLNDPASPVPGPLFRGGSAIAGAFYTANDYPPEYRNTCFFGDYVTGFIRTLSVDATNKPLAVKDFIADNAVVVSMTTHPTDGALYYVSFYPSEIRKIVYRAPDRAPIAVASADKTYGPGPLTVQFTGDKSYDPDGRPLTYSWSFGDGGSSTAANPIHTYAAGSPTNYTVTLTVQDNSLSGQTSLVMSANNMPPQVSITSPTDGTKYPMDKTTIYPLRATVTDPEHSSSQLTYEWQTTLYHDDHNHPEPINTNPETTTTITPLGCGTEIYSYRISLTVTDALGLATKKEVTLYPDCSSMPNQLPTADAGTDKTITTSLITLNGQGSDPDGTISSYGWTKISGKAATLSGAATQNLTVSGLVAGSYTFRLTVVDNGGASAFDDVNVTVNPAPAGPQIVSFMLIDNTTKAESELAEGGVIDLMKGTSFNIRAKPGTATVSRVDFTLTGTEQRTNSDKAVPFTLIVEGKNSAWRPQIGAYTLSAKPYATNATNSGGNAYTISFRVANGSVAAQTSAATLPGGAGAWAAEQVQVYPNPFTDQLSLHIQAKDTGKHTVKIYDMLGKVVLVADDVPTGKPVSLGRQLPAGVYTLMVGSGVTVKHYRIIKAN